MKSLAPLLHWFKDACTEDKQYATKWSNNAEILVTKPLKIVHSASCSPMRNTSVREAKYSFLFLLMIFKENMGVYDEMQRIVI
jgi:hypothetical protein